MEKLKSSLAELDVRPTPQIEPDGLCAQVTLGVRHDGKSSENPACGDKVFVFWESVEIIVCCSARNLPHSQMVVEM